MWVQSNVPFQKLRKKIAPFSKNEDNPKKPFSRINLFVNQSWMIVLSNQTTDPITFYEIFQVYETVFRSLAFAYDVM